MGLFPQNQWDSGHRVRLWHQPSMYMGPKPFTYEKLEVWGEEMNDFLNEACRSPPQKKKKKPKTQKPSNSESVIRTESQFHEGKVFLVLNGVKTLIGVNS